MWTCAVHTLLNSVFVSAGLEEDGSGHFEIDSESGDVRITELFTQNTEPYHTLKIRAKDTGATPLEDTAVLHVQVQAFIHFIHYYDL